MATGTTLTFALEKIERDFECGICHERYKQPKLLDCTHSFCEDCLKEYRECQYKGAAKIPCPVCRQETVLPETGIPGLKTNFHLISIVEGVALLEKATLKYTEPTLNCAHEGLVTLLTNQNVSKCQKHKEEVNVFFCETCHELICRDCTVKDHCKPQHNYIDHEEASAKFKQSISKKIVSLQGDIEELERSLADTAEAKRLFNGNVSKTHKAVQVKAARAIAKVKDEEKRLHEELETQKRDHNNRLDKHEKEVSKMLQRKQNLLKTVTDVTTTATDSDFLSVYPVINKDLDMLSSQHHPKVAGVRPRQLVIPQTVCNINLGKVTVEDTWQLCREFGKQGSGPGEFESARGIAASQSDEIAVTDWKNKRIVICNNQGGRQSSISTLANDVAATSDQWVAANPLVVMVYNKDSKLAQEFRTVPQSEVGKTDVQLLSVAFKKNGNVIVGDKKRNVLTEHNRTDGSLIRTMPLEITPYYLAVMSNDRIAISSGVRRCVHVVDDHAATIYTIKPTTRGQPVKFCTGVCCNSSGIYIAVGTNDFNTGHIHHYDNNGAFLSCIIQGLYDPCGITFTADGQQLVVADRYSVKIYHKV